MGKAKHVLNVRKENIIYTVDLYTKKEECNTGNRCISAFVDKQEVFMPITPYLGNLAAGTSTPVRILKNNTVYQLVQHGEFYLKIQQTPNQTITLHVGGQNWTDENEHWFPYGTQWTATIVGHDGYNPGALNVSSGTLTDNDVTITATAATVAYVSCTMEVSKHRTTYMCTGFTPSTIKGVQFNSLTTTKSEYSLNVLVTNGAGRRAIMLVGGISLDMTFPSDGHWRAPYRQDLVDYLYSHIGQTVPIQILVY